MTAPVQEERTANTASQSVSVGQQVAGNQVGMTGVEVLGSHVTPPQSGVAQKAQNSGRNTPPGFRASSSADQPRPPSVQTIVEQPEAQPAERVQPVAPVSNTAETGAVPVAVDAAPPPGSMVPVPPAADESEKEAIPPNLTIDKGSRDRIRKEEVSRPGKGKRPPLTAHERVTAARSRDHVGLVDDGLTDDGRRARRGRRPGKKTLNREQREKITMLEKQPRADICKLMRDTMVTGLSFAQLVNASSHLRNQLVDAFKAAEPEYKAEVMSKHPTMYKLLFEKGDKWDEEGNRIVHVESLGMRGDFGSDKEGAEYLMAQLSTSLTRTHRMKCKIEGVEVMVLLDMGCCVVGMDHSFFKNHAGRWDLVQLNPKYRLHTANGGAPELKGEIHNMEMSVTPEMTILICVVVMKGLEAPFTFGGPVMEEAWFEFKHERIPFYAGFPGEDTWVPILLEGYKVVKETRIPTGQAVVGEDQTRRKREMYGQRLKRREEKGKFATGGSRDEDVEMYEEEKPPRRSARLQGFPADESSEVERATSEEEEESEPDQEVRMTVENEWGEDDGSVALLKQSKAQMRDNTPRISTAEINAAGRVGRPYFEFSTVDVAKMDMHQSEVAWPLCLIQVEYTPPDPAKDEGRSRGLKQLEENGIGKTEGREKRNLDGKNEGVNGN
ncbi:hypothetical protein HDV00_010780 [Rhizophlyctis rosea]|nr:hypothetical protein HDV00_010780 [Rhizophlyctis rosea]